MAVDLAKSQVGNSSIFLVAQSEALRDFRRAELALPVVRRREILRWLMMVIVLLLSRSRVLQEKSCSSTCPPKYQKFEARKFGP